MHLRIRTELPAENKYTNVWFYVVAENGIDETPYVYEDLHPHDGQYKEELDEHMTLKRRSRTWLPKRHPRMPFLPDSLNLEFTDLGYRCCFEVQGGIGRWFYNPIPDNPEYVLSAGTQKCQHKFFDKEMVTGGMEGFYMVEKFLQDQGRLGAASRVDRTGPRRYYNLRVYLKFEADSSCDWDTNYTELSVSAGQMLADVFTALCGRNTTDHQQKGRRNFSLTQITRRGLEMGRTYTWGQATETGIAMRDLKWAVEDEVIWVLPSPCGVLC